MDAVSLLFFAVLTSTILVGLIDSFLINPKTSTNTERLICLVAFTIINIPLYWLAYRLFLR